MIDRQVLDYDYSDFCDEVELALDSLPAVSFDSCVEECPNFGWEVRHSQIASAIGFKLQRALVGHFGDNGFFHKVCFYRFLSTSGAIGAIGKFEIVTWPSYPGPVSWKYLLRSKIPPAFESDTLRLVLRAALERRLQFRFKTSFSEDSSSFRQVLVVHAVGERYPSKGARLSPLFFQAVARDFEREGSPILLFSDVTPEDFLLLRSEAKSQEQFAFLGQKINEIVFSEISNYIGIHSAIRQCKIDDRYFITNHP